MDLALRRLGAVTMCLWPKAFTGADGKTYDGTIEMKVKAHDAARDAATAKLSESPLWGE